MQNQYFVTGASGSIGSALIPLLLENPGNLIWLLLRADDEAHLEQRLNELLQFWDLPPERETAARRRLVPLKGDMDEPQFGLPEQNYRELASRCTHIVHCAGVVRMNLPMDVARKHAVDSAKNIVELAIACRRQGHLIKVDFVSTVGVAGKMHGIMPETWISGSREFHNTYEASKAEAEDYLREQIDRFDLPMTIHRPSMVVGDSKTGKIVHFQIFYHLCEFIAGRRTFGILPYLGDATLDTVPVDYVAHVIRWSSEQGISTAGKIFHLCSGPDSSIRLTELQKIVRTLMNDRGSKLPLIISVPSAFFTLILKLVAPLVNEAMRRPMRTLPIFIDYLADRQLFDNRQTLQYLDEQSGPASVAPPVYLENVLSRYLRNALLP
jgi:thioester reductase-like protein